MNITSTGRTIIANDISGGTYFFSVDGAFGGTSVTIDRGNVAGDKWTSLQETLGEAYTMGSATNFLVMLPYGDVSVNLTGGSSIDLDVSLIKVN